MDAYIGEIRVFPYAFAPTNWMLCQGQQMSISQNAALFSIIGTYFGGDGKTSFNLPNLQGRVVVGTGQGTSAYQLGQTGGVTGVALLQAQMPTHAHGLNVNTTQGSQTTSSGAQLAQAVSGGRGQQTVANLYNPTTANTSLSPATLGPAGNGAVHNNLQSYLTTNYCICILGEYPPRP